MLVVYSCVEFATAVSPASWVYLHYWPEDNVSGSCVEFAPAVSPASSAFASNNLSICLCCFIEFPLGLLNLQRSMYTQLNYHDNNNMENDSNTLYTHEFCTHLVHFDMDQVHHFFSPLSPSITVIKGD